MTTSKRQRTSDDQAPGPSSNNAPDPRILARCQAAAQLSATDVKKLEVELARYLLFADKKNIPVKRADIVKHVLKEQPKLLPAVLEGSRRYLKQTFDFSVAEIDYNKTKYYLLKNNVQLPNLQILLRPEHAQRQLALLIVILSFIHMANNSLEETDLWDSLKILGVDRTEAHVEFGDAEKLLNEFVKQMYLEKQKVSTSKGQATLFKWGMRAYHEISMADVLQLVASIYDVDVEVWKKQFSSHEGALDVD